MGLKEVFNGTDKQSLLSKLHSKYWLNTIPSNTQSGNKSLVSMASYQRAIARFVGINSGNRDIPVRFSTGQQSYTDIENIVVLSANINNEEFDAAVGLALHESNHILSTQKDLMKKIEESALPAQFEGFVDTLNYTEKEIKKCLRDFFNFIEDRRIDKLGWDRAPGYRPYYTALYKKYFGAVDIGIGLESQAYRENNLKSYYHRVINVMHPKSDLDALRGLQYIFDLMDLDNIGRLANSYEAYEVGRDILEVVFSNIVAKNEEDEKKNSSEDGEGKPDPNNLDNPMVSGDGEGDKSDDKKDKKGKSGAEKKEEESDGEEDDKEGGSGEDEDKEEDEVEDEKPEPRELTEDEKEEIEKAFDKLKDFINGETKKEKISDDEEQKIGNLSDAKADYEYAQGDHKTGIAVFVIRHMTLDILKSIDIGSRNPGWGDAVVEGTKLGRQLVRKLQLRNEVKIYRSKRKRAGQIDRRLLHAIGVGSTSIFEQVKVEEYGDALAHISIDASGSMDGSKWHNTLVAVTGLSYCATKIKNFNVVVDMRFTQGYSEPVVAVMFDSRKDSFAKVSQLYAHTRPRGLTPEGLCYEAIMKDILGEMKNKNGYFINFSDGAPNITNDNLKRVSSLSPQDIAKVNVNRMKSAGIKVLAFYIGGGYGSSSTFKYMYGKDARTIDTNRIIPLARELNKLFAETM